MSIYTLILEYDSASYLFQVEAEDERAAVHAWREELDLAAFDGFELNSAERLMRELAEPTLNPVNHLTNVWNINLAFGHDLAVLHLIKTDALVE